MKSPLAPHYTERDYAILRSLFESRVMTRAHLADIHFAGHARMAKKRLQKLAADSLVGDRPRRPNEPKLHFLTKSGYDLLDQAGYLASYPRFGYANFRKRVDVSPLTLAHELAVMDVKAAVYRSLREHPTITLLQFATWPILFRFRAHAPSQRKYWLAPDALVRLNEQLTADHEVEERFYLEVDRSTESLPVLGRKASAYLAHAQSNDRSDHLPFRVLWVFRTKERRDHAARHFLDQQPPVLTQAWMTTMDEYLADPFGLIWVRPIDYRETQADRVIPMHAINKPS